MNYMIACYSFGLLASIVFLWLAGDLSVKYSIKTAAKFRLTSLFVGFVLIAISTGLPELSVIISSLFHGIPEISAGAILGSNVCDISLVLGLAILFGGAIVVSRKESVDSFLMLLITSVAMAIVFLFGTLTKLTGALLVILYFAAIWWLWKNSTKKEISREKEEQREAVANNNSFFHTKIGVSLKLLGSVALVLCASELAVFFAVELTKLFALSLQTVGATIFAVGTSLPELSLALNAVKRKEYSLALGNSLGSVLEQGTLLLGLLALFSKQPVDTSAFRGLAIFMFVSFGIIGVGMVTRRKVSRVEGGLMLLVFIAFMIYQLFWVR